MLVFEPKAEPPKPLVLDPESDEVPEPTAEPIPDAVEPAAELTLEVPDTADEPNLEPEAELTEEPAAEGTDEPVADDLNA